MIDIATECDSLITELLKFSKDILHLGTEISDNRLELFEKQIGFELPFDFKYLMKRHNGFGLSGTQVLGLDKSFQGSSLDQIYKFEHFEVPNPMPSEFFPFSPDGFGNHYCLDLSKMSNNLCPVVFWQHDFDYQGNDEVEVCNINFLSWVREVMIEWTLQDTNYDGTEK
jgi:cell wall assembly regulator SMI1